MLELGDGRKERFEVEHDRAGEGEAAQGLPVDAEMDAGEIKGWGSKRGQDRLGGGEEAKEMAIRLARGFAVSKRKYVL